MGRTSIERMDRIQGVSFYDRRIRAFGTTTTARLMPTRCTVLPRSPIAGSETDDRTESK